MSHRLGYGSFNQNNSVGGPRGGHYSAVEMCRYIAIAIVLALVLLMAGAALTVQHYGWPGFLVFMGGLVVLGFIAKRFLPQLFAYLLTRPLRQLGAALHGARIVVHSVKPCDPPPPEEWEPDFESSDDVNDDEPPRIARGRRDGEDDTDEEIDNDDVDQDDTASPVGPLDWFQIELSVVPKDAGPSEGRMVQRQAWMPPMVTAVGALPDLRRLNPFRGSPPMDQFPGSVTHAETEIWNGDEYESPEEEVFGEQRLRMRVGVTREVRAVTITYVHFTNLGEVRLPRVDVTPE